MPCSAIGVKLGCHTLPVGYDGRDMCVIGELEAEAEAEAEDEKADDKLEVWA